MFLEHLLMYLLLYFGAVLALAIAGNILAGDVYKRQTLDCDICMFMSVSDFDYLCHADGRL